MMIDREAEDRANAAMQPRLHLFGHHHRLTEAVREGVPSVGLGLVSETYLLIDIETMAYEVLWSPS